MSVMDPAEGTPAALSVVLGALVAAQAAPAQEASASEEDEGADIATPRAKAASALDAALKARLEWCWDQDDRAGEQLCRILIDMCAWHEHAQLRDTILDLQGQGIALLAQPAGTLTMGAVGEIEEAYQAIKPREDDAAAIAAALGMSLEEARSFGLVGTLSSVGLDDEAPVPVPVAAGMAAPEPEEEEDLETLFRR